METKELKLKDVMCGDWVDVRNDAAPNTPHYERITPSHFLRDEHWYGIELTPEILEKNGWIEDGYFYKAEDGSYIQLGELFEHASFRAEKHGIPREIQTSPHLLKYIHQLQHALRLCGIEKEIVI